MKHIIRILALVLVLPASLAAQQDPVARLQEVLPADVAEQVIARVESARAMELPAQAVANMALEGVAKGRSADEVLAAVDQLLNDMGVAREALGVDGRPLNPGEVEAATAALRMGIDGSDVAALARSGPPGRSLSVPLLVMGGLAQRGLPSDQALEAVAERLAERAPDSELLNTFGVPAGRGFGPAGAPAGVGPEASGGRGAAGGGAAVPSGPPDGAGRPLSNGGRGGGPPQQN